MKNLFKIKDIESLGFYHQKTIPEEIIEEGISTFEINEYKRVRWNDLASPPVIHELWKMTVAEEIVRITLEVEGLIGEPNTLFYGCLKSLEEFTILLRQIGYLKEKEI